MRRSRRGISCGRQRPARSTWTWAHSTDIARHNSIWRSERDKHYELLRIQRRGAENAEFAEKKINQKTKTRALALVSLCLCDSALGLPLRLDFAFRPQDVADLAVDLGSVTSALVDHLRPFLGGLIEL